MRTLLQRIPRWWEHNATRLVGIGALLAAATFLTLAWLRYRLGDANGVDLGIYGQVLWNTAHGQPFAFTVHPHSYLGDHVELGLVLLAPFARAFGSIPTLLAAQSLALAATGPLAYLLARRFLSRSGAAIAALATLLSPFLASAALFEFHFLAFAVPVLLALCWTYESRNLPGFALGALGALLVREDLAPVVVAFGVLALVQRRGWRWWLPAIGLGAAWFLLALKLTALLSGYSGDKFLAYYAWLGSTPGEALRNAVLDPLRWLRHLFGYGNVAFVLGTLGSVAFLPLAAPLRLFPVLPYAAQFLFGVSGSVALETHYSAPLVPFLLWASLAAIRAIHRGTHPWFRRIHGDRGIVYALVLATVLYSAATLGPLGRAPGTVARLLRDPANRVRSDLAVNLPPNVPLAVDFPFLAPAAERPELYSLHYEYRGRKQLSREPYRVPTSATNAAWDAASVLAYQALYPDAVEAGTDGGALRLADLWTSRRQRTVSGFDLVRFTTAADTSDPLPYTVAPSAPEHPVNGSLTEEIVLEGYDGEFALTRTAWFGRSVPTLTFGLTFTATREPGWTLNPLLRAYRNGRVVWSRLVPIAYGFHPTVNWVAGERVRTDYALAVPEELRGAELVLQLVDMRETEGVLDGLRGLTVRVPDAARVGAAWSLGTVR